MVDIPIQLIGYGFPDNLMPMSDYWALPVDRAIYHGGSVVDRPEDFCGEYLYIGMDASMKQEISAALPKLKTVRYLELDAYVIPQEVLDSLQSMHQLKRLALAPTRTTDLHFLDNLIQLEYLSIEAAPNVEDLSPIMRSNKLISLCLGTSATNLDAFGVAKLQELRCLVLSGTGESKPARLSSLLPLQNLRNLEYLCLLNCRVADKSLRFALQLLRLRKMHLSSARWWNTDDIAALIEKGVSVTRVI